MSKDPLSLKIASPYATALFEYSVKQNVLYQITADFKNLELILTNIPDLLSYLSNPVTDNKTKQELLTQTIKSEINIITFNFLSLLIFRNRINLLRSVITCYLQLVYKAAVIKHVEVVTAFPLNPNQITDLTEKLKILVDAREIRLENTEIKKDLIGGFLVKTGSKVIDFTVRTQLQNLAQHLDSILEI